MACIFWTWYNKLDKKLRENQFLDYAKISIYPFDKAFKIAAVKLVIEEGFSVKEVSLQLEVHVNSLYRWIQEVEKYRESAFPEKGSALFDAHYELQGNRYPR
ncbi:transposase [Enterococcus faecalis]|nr:transposase [Enterococcus faecalis]